jgi:hypothetical protein
VKNGSLKFNGILSDNLFKEWNLLQNNPPTYGENLTGVT